MRLFLSLGALLWVSVAHAQGVPPQAPANVTVVGCAYFATPGVPPDPALGVDQQYLAVQCDNQGRLVTSASGGGGGTVTQGPAASSGPWIITPWIGGAVNSATNGLYFNILQGNAVNASGNPIFAQLTAGAASLGTVGLNTGSNVVGKVGVDQTTPGTTNAVAIVPSVNATVGLTPVVSSALEPGHVFKASAGNLYAAYVTATSSYTNVGGFFVCVNATSVPAAGAITPLDFVAMPVGAATVGISYSPGPPAVYSTGITCMVTIATTPYTYTVPSSNLAFHGLVD
jgi:hypothetical protein